jgi:hypothetical protein
VRRTVLDGRLFGRIDQQIFVSRLTVQQDTATGPNAFGDTVPVWGPVAGLSGIPCMISPASAFERREPQNVLTETTHIALLSTYLPQIATRMRALIDNVPYDITAVESDSRHAVTRLQLRVVST